MSETKVGGAADLLDLLGDLGPPPVTNNVMPAMPVGHLDGMLSPARNDAVTPTGQMNGSAGTVTLKATFFFSYLVCLFEP